MKKRLARALVVLAAVALLAGACGGGRSDSADDGDGGGGSSDVTTVDSSTFGDLPSPCGEGDASGATDQGVTDTSITIGYGDDAGFPTSPGLNHQMADAVKAMIEWCNAQGGILGRQIVGNYHDAAITEVNNAVTDSCESDFFLVGQGYSLDASQESVRRGCGLPSVAGFAVSPQFSNAPLHWEPLPVPADYTVASPAAQLAELFPDAVKKASVMFANYSATIDSKDKVVSAYPEFGWEFLDCPVEYKIGGEADWRPLVQQLKDCGAEIVYWAGSPYPNFQNMLTAAAQLEYEPIWTVDVNHYDENFAAWNGTDGYADNVYFRMSLVPFEEAADNAATQQYLDVVEASGGDPSTLGMQSASAFLLWATAAKECGSTLTRACVAEKLDAVEDWTGGGLHAPGHPGSNLPTDCGALFKLQGAGFERVTPSEVASYECDPTFAAKTSGPVLDRAKLDADRISSL